MRTPLMPMASRPVAYKIYTGFCQERCFTVWMQAAPAGASVHFSDWGGGGGVRKFSTFSARGTRRKIENFVCLVLFLC